MPSGWSELSQDELYTVVRLLRLYQQYDDWAERVQVAVLLHFCRVKVVRRVDGGWLCREGGSGRTFVLDPGVVPSMLEKVEWVTRPEELRQRIALDGAPDAVDFELRRLMFGDYLVCENYYQAFLQTRDEGNLKEMARVLYRVKAPKLNGLARGLPLRSRRIDGVVLTGVFLWWGAAKRVLSEWFPHFLRPAADAAGTVGVTQERQGESMRAQIRLLTKGDVTKQDYILNKTDTWTALGELDALAREAEELRKK